MTLGPLEYLVIGFEGSRFTEQIMPALRGAWEKGIIRVIDLFLLRKDESGRVASLEVGDLSGEKAECLAPRIGNLLDLLAPDDVEQLARGIPNNCSAVILLFEHTWAIDLKKAIDNASGIVVAEGLVPPGVLRGLEEVLSAPASNAEPNAPGQLKQLRALRDSKVLTEAEYENARRKILGDL